MTLTRDRWALLSPVAHTHYRQKTTTTKPVSWIQLYHLPAALRRSWQRTKHFGVDLRWGSKHVHTYQGIQSVSELLPLCQGKQGNMHTDNHNQSLPLCQGKQGNMHTDNHLQGKQGKHFRNLKPGKGCRPQVHTQCLQVTQVLPGNLCTEPSSTSRSRDGCGERDFTVYGCETNLA